MNLPDDIDIAHSSGYKVDWTGSNFKVGFTIQYPGLTLFNGSYSLKNNISFLTKFNSSAEYSLTVKYPVIYKDIFSFFGGVHKCTEKTGAHVAFEDDSKCRLTFAVNPNLINIYFGNSGTSITSYMEKPSQTQILLRGKISETVSGMLLKNLDNNFIGQLSCQLDRNNISVVGKFFDKPGLSLKLNRQINNICVGINIAVPLVAVGFTAQYETSLNNEDLMSISLSQRLGFNRFFGNDFAYFDI